MDVLATGSMIDGSVWSGGSPPFDAPLEGMTTSTSGMVLMPSVQLDAEVGGRTAAPLRGLPQEITSQLFSSSCAVDVYMTE
jgi:hypothetical protein